MHHSPVRLLDVAHSLHSLLHNIIYKNIYLPAILLRPCPYHNIRRNQSECHTESRDKLPMMYDLGHTNPGNLLGHN